MAMGLSLLSGVAQKHPFSENYSDPVSYAVVTTFAEVTVDSSMLEKKQIISISKLLQDNLTSPNPEAYSGYKFHNETSYTGGHFLAVRCDKGGDSME